MRYVVALSVAALLWTASAAAGPQPAVPAPTGLHAFVYRADEPVKSDHTYALMPAFAWNVMHGATSYELQLATSKAFADATLLYHATYAAPVASIQAQVPWMTGHPYALWVRVRAVANGRTSPWSTPFGFNTAWQDLPKQLPAPEGLIRWTPVDGATGYQVWFQRIPGNFSESFPTITNVADEREFWTFHPQLAGTVQWRVRAIRLVTNSSLPDGIPIVSHGPYSPVYTTTVSGQLNSGPIRPVAAVSDVESTPSSVKPHQLTPGFAWTGSTDALGDRGSNLWRVYVFSDKQCVNPVLTSSIVGSPAWAPRETDPLALPGDTSALALAQSGTYLGAGSQSGTFTADFDTPNPSEQQTLTAGASGSSSSSSSSPSTSGPPTSSSTAVATPRAVSLPDNGWPQGRYWWTVVPVKIVPVPPKAGSTSSSSSSSSSGSGSSSGPPPAALEYHDMALPQDLCAAGEVWPFGMQSAPITTSSQTPFASGIANGTRVVSAATRTPSFERLPLVTWKPALAASTYDIQLSRQIYPWRAVRPQTSVVPSTVLPLSKQDLGTWYYRVRGVNPNLVGPAQKLAWSTPVAIRISGDRFVVVK